MQAETVTGRRSELMLEILWSRMIGIVDEAAVALVRTSFSSAVRDFQDYACALFDHEGNLMVQATKSTPGLLGVLPPTVGNMLRVYPVDKLEPGDVLMTNDPWLATGHLIDITVCSPIYYRDRLIGLALCVVHHWDIGGRLGTTDSKDVFEEGLKIPVVKAYRRGEPNPDVFEFIRANVRMPDNTLGDLRAQIAATHVMTRRLHDLMSESHLSDLAAVSQEILTRSEASVRAAIAQVPDGVYRHERDLDIIDQFDRPLHVAVEITVQGGDITIDYHGSSRQVERAINSVLNMTQSYTGFAVKSALNPSVPNNAGSLRPIHLKADEGSILNARWPAPTWGRTMIVHWLPELIYYALSSAIPDRVVAGSGGTPLSAHVMYGRRQDGRPFLIQLSQQGGLGARAGKDGVACLAFPGNVANIPIEVNETDAPILFLRKELRSDSGGAGRCRGGWGQEVRVRICDGDLGPQDDRVLVGLRAARFDHPVPGLCGGLPGARSELYINDKAMRTGSQQTMRPGDVLLFKTAGGGGFGDPEARDPVLVERDVRCGLVSPQAAYEQYGVVLDAAGRLDDRATRTLRGTRQRVGQRG